MLRIALERWGSRVIPYWYAGWDAATADSVIGTATGSLDGAIWLADPLADRTIGLACVSRLPGPGAGAPEVRVVIENSHRATLEIAPRERHRLTVAVGVAVVEHQGDDA